MPIPKASEVTTTVGTEKEAVRLANAIVRERLAACVQFWPIRSTYHWRGKIEAGAEIRLSCKTRPTLVPALIQYIRAHHSYELPEIIATPIPGGLPEYLAWIQAETAQPRLTFPPPATRKRTSRSGRNS
jgi:periplasmic divalent cation tolerance protein